MSVFHYASAHTDLTYSVETTGQTGNGVNGAEQ